MICILASAQLCDTLFPNIMENNKSVVQHAHCCVYYLSRSTFYRESVCLLSESKSQITAVSPSILARYKCKTRYLEQYPTLVGTTDVLKHHPHASWMMLNRWFGLWWLYGQSSLSAEATSAFFMKWQQMGPQSTLTSTSSGYRPLNSCYAPLSS